MRLQRNLLENVSDFRDIDYFAFKIAIKSFVIFLQLMYSLVLGTQREKSLTTIQCFLLIDVSKGFNFYTFSVFVALTIVNYKYFSVPEIKL